MTLADYVARGFPGQLDKAIASVAVAGIDLVQAKAQLRYCPETESALYGHPPPASAPTPGTRPVLEAIVADLPEDTLRKTALEAMAWTNRTITHAHLVPERVRPDRGYTEEQLITSGVGWCNEQSRVFLALCAFAGLPGRLCFVYHRNLRCGHTAAEVFIDGRWAFFDPTFAVSVELPEGRLAEARELSGQHRPLAHQAYRAPLVAYYDRCQSHVEDQPGWRAADRPDVDRGGDLLAYLGFTGYALS